MVNYCCVVGCGRNSKNNKQLNFYSLPKQRRRQKQWLKAAGKEDLLDQDMENLRKKLRFCSRHFTVSSIKNKHLNVYAVPTLRLPGSAPEQDALPSVHEGIFCNVCTERIIGFRYKCVTCDNFDICQKCEMLEIHEEHYMLRIPKPLKFKLAEDLISRWREIFPEDHQTKQGFEDSNSSDDEPITKYLKNENFINLSQDVKYEIKDEIQRAMKSLRTKRDKEKMKTKETDNVTNFIDITKSLTPIISTGDNITLTATQERDFKNEHVQNTVIAEIPPQLIFADTSEMKYEDVKSETMASLSVVNTSTVAGQIQPVIYLKLNDVLTELMITPSDQNTTSSDIFHSN
ncbi:unnamed protein product [Leptosia nina]|uniref:Uncharacterized protein n=1 Tax=Leptosia nina TaxID=320188 RepID=A0AAV1JD04_9NEOP